MMGRGSDTRMYSPRSESSHMYGSANEDGGKYSPTSPEDADKRREEKQRKDEERKARLKDIKHIKIKPSQGLGSGPKLPTEEGLDDGNKRDDEREISLQGGPAGSRGHLLDLATGAKTGTGSAMGTGNSAVRTGEPMNDAWSELLKELPTGYSAVGPSSRCDNTEEGCDGTYEAHYRGPEDNPKELVDIFCPKCGRYHEITGDEYDRYLQTDMARGEHPSQQNIQTGEPMKDAWSTLLKEDDEYNFSVNDVINTPKHTWYSQIMGRDTPMVDTLVDSGIMSVLGYANHHHGDPETISDLHEEDVSVDTALENLMNHRNSLMVLDAKMQGKEDTIPQQFHDYHNDFAITRMMEDLGVPPHIQAGEHLGLLYSYLNYLGYKIGPQMGEADDDFNMKYASKPMGDAWSELLKRDTPKKIQARRRREARQEFRPSTGQFKKPPGGQSGGAGATMRRFKARMRGIKGGKRTGLMKPHLSVEMSHRGIATKQPMSKDPQKYRQYMGQQEAQKILGGVRNTFSPHARHSARSFVAGPTGGGRLTGMLPGQAGQMRQPSLTRLGRPRRPRMPRMPRMPRPPMPPQMPMMPPSPPMPIMTSEDTPSQIMMSSDRTESEILKANRHARKLEMLELMRRLIDLQKKRNKLMKYVQGGGSAFENGHVPNHPAGVQQHEDEDEKNDGPTQNLETNSSRLGLDPAGHLSGKRGHFG